MSYSDVFGGSSVQSSDVQFRAVALSASIVTVWPAFATSGNQCARIMRVTPSAGSLSVTLPDATLTSAGMDVLFDNPSATTFSVLDSDGGLVATVDGGAVKYFYLSDNGTAAGTWRVVLFGAAASSVDAAQLAGYGLKALSTTLNTAAVVSDISSNTTVTLADRSKVFVWTGGSGTLTLPSTIGSTSDYAIEVHNHGTGTLTVATTGGVLVDGSATIALVVTESCFLHMGATDWYTVGRGRNTQFNFTQLNKVVTGGTTALTLTEASNVVQTYTGVLTSNQIVNQPAVVQVYYVSNATTGAYTLTFGCVAGGTSVAVTQGQAAILFCDGTNIVNANTSLSGGISTIVFGAGSAAAPSVALLTSSTGFYSSGANEIGVTCNGVYMGKFTTGGFRSETAVANSVSAISSGAAASAVVSRPAGSVGSVRLQTAGIDRWVLAESTTAEAGANAGSNYSLTAYDDAGASLGTAYSVVRSTQVVTFTQPPALVGTNITGTAAGLTAGTVTTNANLTGHITSTGNAAVLGSFTLAQLNAAVSDADVAILGANTFTAAQVLSDQQVSRAMLLDCGLTVVNKGNSGTSTQTYDYTAGSVQTSTATGNHTIATSNWPPTGNLGNILIVLTNGGAYTLTWPTISWLQPNGTTTTSISTYLAANTGRTALQTSGVDQILLWSQDAGTTIYGKLV